MSNKLRIGVIGTGLAWERLHYPAINKLGDKFEVVALCNKTMDKAKEAAKPLNITDENIYSDYNEMLKRNDIDVIDLLVPISENFEVAREIIKAGKNLIAEKPFASSPQAAEELINLKNQRNVKVMIAENFVYDECNTKIKQLIKQKVIGDIIYFVAITGADFEKKMLQDTFAEKEWRQHPFFKGGIFLDGGVHDIARMRFLFGDVDSVFANAKPHDKEYCPYEAINALIKFKENVTGHYIYYSKGAELFKPPVGLRIFGTNGEIYLESKEKGTIEVSLSDGTNQHISYTPDNGYYNEFLDYYDCITNNKEFTATPESELGDIQMIYNILESIETSQIIK